MKRIVTMEEKLESAVTALRSISEMVVNEKTDKEQLLALCLAIAKTEVENQIDIEKEQLFHHGPRLHPLRPSVPAENYSAKIPRDAKYNTQD